MSSVKSAVRAVGVCVAAMAVISGCASAKRAGEAAAPAAAAAAPQAPAAAGAMAAGDTYVVVTGDCLWCISGKSEIYGDPYQWPLLYRANKDQIKDADLIYPGQELSVDRNASAGLQAAADKHARTRGSWVLGVTEESDIGFLQANP